MNFKDAGCPGSTTKTTVTNSKAGADPGDDVELIATALADAFRDVFSAALTVSKACNRGRIRTHSRGQHEGT
jgi:hypothetical protein